MKKFSLGVITGLLIGLLAFTTLAIAGDNIKLIINGKEIACDVAPQVINGRTMVPARFVAEGLGATATWDAGQNAVVITSNGGGVPTDLNPVTTSTAINATNPTTAALTANKIVNGVEIVSVGEVQNYQSDIPPKEGYKYICFSVTLKNTTDQYKYRTNFEAVLNPNNGKTIMANPRYESCKEQLDELKYIPPFKEVTLSYVALIQESSQVVGWKNY